MATADTLPVVIQSGDGKVFQFPSPTEAAAFEDAALQGGGETQRLVPATPPAARPLYCLESHLAALLDTEELVTEDQEREYALELQATLNATIEKRDKVGQFRGHLVSQIEFAHAEVGRLQRREAFYQAALDRLDGYLTRIIDMLGLDPKGKRKKLEGNTLTISLHGCDKRVEITDEQAVPTKYKRVTVTLPAETWELVCDSLDLDLRAQVLGEVKSPKVEVSLSSAKGELKDGVVIPGLQLTGGTYVECK
jgi:hypothetical protein